jgi:hypothetical protein
MHIRLSVTSMAGAAALIGSGTRAQAAGAGPRGARAPTGRAGAVAGARLRARRATRQAAQRAVAGLHNGQRLEVRGGRREHLPAQALHHVQRRHAAPRVPGFLLVMVG